MSKEDHNIDADDRGVFDVLNERKYTVDYFQREYSWEQKHIEQLVSDLTSAFFDAYREGDQRTAVEGYNKYYLGPFVVSSKDGKKSIIDGQQRLTSLTLFLIYLNNLQKEIGGGESIEPLIFSTKFGQKSFNLQVEERERCLNGLFTDGVYEPRPDDDESTVNLVERYANIAAVFPDELKNSKLLPYFLDWLKYNVVLVEITAHSDDNAYAIFESMNDRGLNLTSTEMLKGYILSRFSEQSDREKANKFWRASMQKLHTYSKEEDQQFIQAWLRGCYAETFRQSKVGSSNEDFEKIGTRFHSWFRDNHSKLGLVADNADGFRRMIEADMAFYLRWYFEILDAQKVEKSGLENVFYSYRCNIAPSLAFPMMLAPLRVSDSDDETRRKINEVGRYIENFTVRRSVNFRNFGASSIKYTMFSIIKEIRGRSFGELRSILQDRLDRMEEKWDGVLNFRMHGMNAWFVKYLLSRITGFIDQQAGLATGFATYYEVTQASKKFEIEHIWADKFEEHRDEFDQQTEFDNYRNRIGDLILLQRGTNQSFGALPYSEKRKHYLKQNLYAQSLHEDTYEKNPNFTNMASRLDLNFQPHREFKREDVEARQALVKAICERIWALPN